ncbi:MAG: hypothetical protein JWO67_164 [Streptosporangiaceae bacterium]|nr:hypothetical protein [Streptosporangiaceae bacterium]
MTSPARFFRVIACVYELHDEVAAITLDEAARRRLADELRFLRETLRETVSADAYAELTRLDRPLGPDPTQDELRVACSELLGWLIALLPEAERAAGGPLEAEPREGPEGAAGGPPAPDEGARAGETAAEGSAPPGDVRPAPDTP